ncbi:hypothetical protein ACVWXN_007013 [Bradyrhizobium sp. i1.4.4]
MPAGGLLASEQVSINLKQPNYHATKSGGAAVRPLACSRVGELE